MVIAPRGCWDHGIDMQAFCNIPSPVPPGMPLALWIIFHVDLHFHRVLVPGVKTPQRKRQGVFVAVKASGKRKNQALDHFSSAQWSSSDSPVNLLNHWFSMYAPRTRSTWELAVNANPWVPPRPAESETLGVRLHRVF